MKKSWITVSVFMMLLLTAMSVAGSALGEAAVGAVGTEDEPELFTWTTLLSTAGCAAATMLVVEVLKNPLDKLIKLPTSIFAYIIALAIQLAATAFTSGLTFETGALAALNAFVIAFAAMGGYDKTIAKIEK